MFGLTLSPCRWSFVLCAFLALLTDYDHASHITVADPPELRASAPQPREQPI